MDVSDHFHSRNQDLPRPLLSDTPEGRYDQSETTIKLPSLSPTKRSIKDTIRAAKKFLSSKSKTPNPKYPQYSRSHSKTLKPLKKRYRGRNSKKAKKLINTLSTSSEESADVDTLAKKKMKHYEVCDRIFSEDKEEEREYLSVMFPKILRDHIFGEIAKDGKIEIAKS